MLWQLRRLLQTGKHVLPIHSLVVCQRCCASVHILSPGCKSEWQTLYYLCCRESCCQPVSDPCHTLCTCSSKLKKKKKLKMPQIRINLSNCKYEVCEYPRGLMHVALVLSE